MEIAKKLYEGNVVTYEEIRELNTVRIDIEELWKSIDSTAARVDLIPMYKRVLEEKRDEIKGKIALVGGRGPIWLYALVIHWLHGLVPAVLIEDPKLGGYIVLYNHAANISAIVRKAEEEAVKFVSKQTFVPSDDIKAMLIEIFKQNDIVLNEIKEMYKQYLDLKRKQVELLEQASDRDRTRYD